MNQIDRVSKTACPHCYREIPPKVWIQIGGRLAAALRQNLRSKPTYDSRCPRCHRVIDDHEWINTGSALSAALRKTRVGFVGQTALCPHCNSKRPSKLELRYVHLPNCGKNPNRREGEIKNGKPCRWCRQLKGAMELRYHEPRCKKNPTRKKD